MATEIAVLTSGSRSLPRSASTHAVTDDVRLRSESRPLRPPTVLSDAELRAAALSALRGEGDIQADAFTVSVANGVVTLDGCTDCHYQRADVERAIRFLDGVTVIENRIRVQPPVTVADVRAQIADVFHRAAAQSAAGIEIRTDHGIVTLRGGVRSADERIALERAVRSLPGVTSVNADLVVTK